MWSSYSTRQAAQLVGLPESAIRSCIRAGLIAHGAEIPAQLSFRDLSALRTLKGLLDAGISLSRARRELGELQRQLPPGASIAELPIEARGGHVHVRGGGTGHSGAQLELRLEVPPGEVATMPVRRDAPAPNPAPPITADEWFDRAVALEETDPTAAVSAYRRALQLRPDGVEAWINLGRLFAESSDPRAAVECFEAALRLDPADATALYNLGVVAQDGGREREAIDYYGRALDLDPTLAEAHYNLATLFDQGGDPRAAIRHINEYRKLTKS